jgi:hypothetical protein
MSGDAADHVVHVAPFGVQAGVGVGVVFGDAPEAVRDSNHPYGPQLAFPVSTWQAFTDQVRVGS